MSEEYFLDQDESCHWYIVPEINRQEWNDWCDIDEDDEASWNVPDFAKELGTGPNAVIFQIWRIYGSN